MRATVSGASGLIGGALVTSLLADGHEVTVLVRRPGTSSGRSRQESADGDKVERVAWDPERGELDPAALAGCRAFFNFSGAPIGDRRWTRARKEELVRSRVGTTKLLAEAAACVAPRDSVLVNASAIGYYGDRAAVELSEQSEPGSGFLADLCRAWEDATEPARKAGLRVVNLRSGIVLSRSAGALAKQLPLFRSGLGGRLGSGRQWVSWITLEDEVAVIRYAAADPGLSGPVNAVSPEPVTNATFTRELARLLRRPGVLAVPAIALRVVFGSELADQVMLASQRVRPAKLLANGYRFTCANLATGLQMTLRTPSRVPPGGPGEPRRLETDE